MNKKILIICTGNSARSQMAEGLLKSFDSRLEVYSAGTYPAQNVNPYAITVMCEIGIDISQHHPKNINQFISNSFDYVITVCDNAKETCPVFFGNVTHRLHFNFEDPAEARGNEAEVLSTFRRVRDEINKVFHHFYTLTLRQE